MRQLLHGQPVLNVNTIAPALLLLNLRVVSTAPFDKRLRKFGTYPENMGKVCQTDAKEQKCYRGGASLGESKSNMRCNVKTSNKMAASQCPNQPTVPDCQL